MIIYGVDFTSAPCDRKPITVAVAEGRAGALAVSAIEDLEDFAAFEKLLMRPGPWVGGFDFPFGISREAVNDLAWPRTWTDLVAHCRGLGRLEFKRVLDTYRQSRPAGKRYAKRSGDTASGAHPSVKLVRPPVGFMFLEGASRLALANVHIPMLRPARDASRVALEAYPGLLVRKLGIRGSYKSDDPRQQNSARKTKRKQIVEELLSGRTLEIRLQLPTKLHSRLLEDGSGDSLDAVMCALQAHWGWLRRNENFGLPAEVDPIEGWIVSA